ncbi:MAG: ABC transporter ATP-binding protein [Verrucomicrobiota bacterium]
MGDFLRHLWPCVAAHRGRLVAGVLSGLVYAIGSGLLMLAIKLVLEAIFPTAGARDLMGSFGRLPAFLRDPLVSALDSMRVQADSKALPWLIGSVPFAMMLRGAGAYLSLYCMTWVSVATIHDLRVRLFRHLEGLSLDYFSEARTGDLQSRLMNDTQAIQNCIAQGFGTISKEPATIIGILVFLISVQPQLTLVALVIFPVVVVPVVVYGRKVRKSWKATQIHTAELSDLMQETFTGIRVVKAFNLEESMARRFLETSRRITGQFMRYIRGSELPGPVIEVFGAVGVSLMLFYVMRLPAGQRPSAGDFTSFVLSLFTLYQPIKNLSRLWGQLEQGRAAGERLFPILATSSSVVEPAQPKAVRAQGSTVAFEGVGFAYGERPALDGFSLSIPAGSLVALVGEIGSGKTTVANLLLRFYDPQQGRIRIGGIDLREVSTSDLHDQIAVVGQDTMLFNDTIRANIRMGRPGATDVEIEAAARAAHAEGFIREKPLGYDTPVGERGSSLSGGQRQRIAIARAILRNAPILVLDEATSALDAESERAVQAALETLMSGRTTLCIAHRLSTIQRADVIVAMEAGCIVEQGTHVELLARGGLYARLHALQSGAA